MIVDLKLTTEESYYLRANDLENEDHFTDLTGITWAYRQPDDDQDNEDCVKICINNNFKVNDGMCEWEHKAICSDT